MFTHKFTTLFLLFSLLHLSSNDFWYTEWGSAFCSGYRFLAQSLKAKKSIVVTMFCSFFYHFFFAFKGEPTLWWGWLRTHPLPRKREISLTRRRFRSPLATGEGRERYFSSPLFCTEYNVIRFFSLLRIESLPCDSNPCYACFLFFSFVLFINLKMAPFFCVACNFNMHNILHNHAVFAINLLR